MDNCLRCGISGEKALLYDVITLEGVQKICRKCSFKEELPLIKNKNLNELKDFEKKHDIFERISRVSKIDNKKKLNQRNFVLEQQESTLKDLVEKNICKGLNKNAKPREDLVRNFHWIIKRQRRIKKVTIKQFALVIHEAEKTLEMAEQGVIPEGYDLIRKIENFLGIILIKDEPYQELVTKEKQLGKELTFDRFVAKDIMISDLHELEEKKKEKRGGFFGFFSRKKEEPEQAETLEYEQPDEEIELSDEENKAVSKKKEISSKDIDNLIFGKSKSL